MLVTQHCNNSRTLIITDKSSVRTNVHNVGKQSISFMATDKKEKKIQVRAYSEETHTLSTVKTANEVSFLHVDHATCVNKFFLVCFYPLVFPTGSFSFLACTLFSLNLINLLALSRDVPPQDYNIIPVYIDQSILMKINMKWKNGKTSKKLPREIRSVWNTKSSIHLFKTGNSVVYSEPNDAGTTELGKTCHNHFG